jgi:hypothetical protein
MSGPRGTGGGVPTPPVSPEARDQVVEVLTRHFADDRLSEAQLEERLERVYHAATMAELGAIVADLPAAAEGLLPAVPAGEDPVRRIEALLSGQQQRVTGEVPRALRVRSRLGYVELDLTRATFAPGLTTIDVRAFMGYAQVLLPPGVRVDCRGRAFAGYFSLRGASRAGGADAPSEVRITGRATCGYAECIVAKPRTPRLPDRTD